MAHRGVCVCGRPYWVGEGCPVCGYGRRGSGSQQARIPRSHAERKRRAQAVADWIAAHGPLCPGFRRPPHPSHDLTADHVVPQSLGGLDGPLQVLCRRCNTARGGANRIPRHR